jgi:hypothetical protein
MQQKLKIKEGFLPWPKQAKETSNQMRVPTRLSP